MMVFLKRINAHSYICKWCIDSKLSPDLLATTLPENLFFGEGWFKAVQLYAGLYCERLNPPLRFKSGALRCSALSLNAPLARAGGQSQPRISPGGRHELINIQVSVQSEGVFTLPPRREVRSCTGRETAARRSEPRSSQAGSPSPTASTDWTRRLLHSLRWTYCRISL